jgi:hypothetical protein
MPQVGEILSENGIPKVFAVVEVIGGGARDSIVFSAPGCQILSRDYHMVWDGERWQRKLID